MVDVRIEIKNLPQIKAAFNKSPEFMGKHFTAAIKKATELIRAASVLRTPVRTGFLRNSHVTRYFGSGLHFSGEVQPTAYYAGFVHEGTRFQRPQPFLRKGAESSLSQLDQIFAQAMQSALNDIARMT